MKVFPAHYICSFLLAKAYTKSDIKAIQDYAGKFPYHEDVDIARREMEPEISLLFDKFSLCTDEHQLRTILKNQPTKIKFFIFERIVVALSSIDVLDKNFLLTPESLSMGESFTKFLQKIWELLLHSCEEKNLSVSQQSLKMLQSYQKNHP